MKHFELGMHCFGVSLMRSEPQGNIRIYEQKTYVKAICMYNPQGFEAVEAEQMSINHMSNMHEVQTSPK